MPNLDDVKLKVTTKNDTKGLSDTESKLEKFTSRIQKLAAVAAGAWVTDKLIAFGKESLNLAQDLEKAQISLGIMAERFGHNRDEANALAKTLGKDLRIGVGSASESLQNLIKQGFSLDQASDLLKRFTNEAITGKSANIDLATAVENLSFAYATGNSALGNMSGMSENFIDLQKNGAKVLAEWNGKAEEQGEITGDMASKLFEYQESLIAANTPIDEIGKNMEKYAGMLELTNLTMGASQEFQGTYGDNILILEGKIREIQTAFGTWLKDGINPVVMALANSMPTIEQIQGFIGGLTEMVSGNSDRLWFLQDAWNRLREFLVVHVQPSLQRIYDKLREFGQEIAPYIKLWLDKLGQWWAANGEKVMAIVRVVWSLIELIITTAIDLISGVLRVGMALIAGDWGMAWEAIKDTFTSIWDNMLGFAERRFNDLMYLLREGLNWAIEQLDKLIDKIPLVGGVVDLPGFANGVQNFSGGVALVGEEGPELVNLPRGSDVIPNNQIGNALGGAGVNIEQVNINNGTDMSQFTQELAFAVRTG